LFLKDPKFKNKGCLMKRKMGKYEERSPLEIVSIFFENALDFALGVMVL